MDKGAVAVQLESDSERNVLVVRQAGELPLLLRQQIAIGDILAVDGRASEDVTLKLRAAERFFIESVTDGKTPLNRIDTADADGAAVFRIADGTRTVRLNLGELTANRQASIIQTAQVNDDNIRWSAECRLAVSVQPVYRQQIRVSEDVDITGITAERDGASLSRAWTRNGEPR